jgi:16S rRNA (cytosine967-C5)-methyltransferase
MTEISGLNSRRYALKILKEVILKNCSLEEAHAENGHLSDQDIGFAKALVMTTLRLYGPLTHLLRQSSDQGKKIKPEALNIIACMGAAQILLLNVPDHAAVDTSMKLALKSGFMRQKGFLNALLRRIAAKKDQIELTVNAKTSHYPEWLLKNWQSSYGKDETDTLIAALTKEAPLDLTIPNKNKREAFLKHYDGQCTAIGNHSVRFSGDHPDVTDIQGFKDGYWWVQDAASAHPISHIIENNLIENDWSTLKILDLCAAPGGKTMQLASTGAHVTALDSSEKRLDRVKENLERTSLGGNVKVICEDALSHHGKYDLIVLDAPCTATGTLRRHPDAAFTKSKEQMAQLTALQKNILDAAQQQLSPNGHLLYCTCSLQNNEGENILNQIDRELFSIKKLNNNGHGYFRSLPQKAPLYGDGFFAALLQRH